MILSPKQLDTIFNFTSRGPLIVSCGPFGCGKSVCDSIGIGYTLAKIPPVPGNNYVIFAGRTLQSVKSNICNNLTAYFGDDFKYTKSQSDGYAKDALLFGHKVVFFGVNDANSAKRIQGKNAYIILADEVSLYSKENFELLFGRLRCDYDVFGTGYFPFICNCNPEGPDHWLKKMIDQEDSPITYIKWSKTDRIDSGAKLYYENLERLYAQNEAYLRRYVYGEWTVTQGCVYKMFNPKLHIFSKEEAPSFEGASYSYYKIGIDWGSVHPCVITVVGVMPAGEHVLLKEIVLKETALTKVCEAVISAANSVGLNNLKGIYYDPSALHVAIQLKEMGFPAGKLFKANNNVMQGIDTISNMLVENTLIVSYKCEKTISEFLSYSWGTKPGENVVKINDDCLDSLRYAIMG